MPKASTSAAVKAPRGKKSAAQPVKELIEEAYWNYVLEHGQEPASVFKFTKDHGWKEEEFYAHFSTFQAIEKAFWRSFTEETVAIVNGDPDAAEYDARQKLLAFYFTFFEGMLQHRSKLLCRLPRKLESARVISGMTDVFSQFAEAIIAEGRLEGSIAGPSKLDSIYKRGLKLHLLWLLDYYRRDTSSKFEDTDALIEKSVRFFFDAARWSVIESAFDLARFLTPRNNFR
ncbi:hypothetical protein JIN85_07115 [Luteolibacter pohnpeiensis]|uniref:Tetracyclin repressor-like C-terminal domain-containing protein n=1 Tax=Luteolibacter pohnpeiensis TaxID=454153 RepID=A0A934S9M0_9BACT|nr:hypothetical protein [Luteolibacter pohnpeiensis]MBK1882177.1 hypothetical protein [Luteolibacter pohnpeiensis]